VFLTTVRRSVLWTLLTLAVCIIGLTLSLGISPSFREPVGEVLLGLGLEPWAAAMVLAGIVVGLAVCVYGLRFLIGSIRRRKG
jgi:hypothetical protein